MRIGTVTGLALVAASVAAAVVLSTTPEVAAPEEPSNLTLVVTAEKPDCPAEYL
ncbi:hypothetical protein [Actinoplanes aureus]|uniref:Uncharacterized protein n=1 Tax=Actinoplanes aureus TaxID=2792083 RepID=A0A931G073_9ACTN|nr:hypothetical protein [Actinoplanes aureus]MBG0565482.1 hypothetical protein [Actinoplanes aureus]